MSRTGIVSLAVLGAALGASGALAQMRVPLPKADDTDKVVITGMVPIPDVGDGAPQFTSNDLASLGSDTETALAQIRSDMSRCGGSPTGASFSPTDSPSITNLLAQEYEASARVIAAASHAEDVTTKAELVRRDAANGKADTKAVEDAELKRQDAVKMLQKAREQLAEAQAMVGDYEDMAGRGRKDQDISWGELQMRSMNRQKEHVGVGIGEPQSFDYLRIGKIQAHQLNDTKTTGKPFVRVSGEIRNTSNTTVPVPGLSIALVDQQGWVLHSQSLETENGKSLGPGKAAPFQIDVRPAPDAMKTAIVTFAAKHAAQPRARAGFFCAMQTALSGGSRGPLQPGTMEFSERNMSAPPNPPRSRGPR